MPHRDADDSKDWALIAAEHVADEPAALAANEEVASAELAKMLSDWGLALREPLVRLLYLDRCAMPNGRGLHAVLVGRPAMGRDPFGGAVACGDGLSAAMKSIGLKGKQSVSFIVTTTGRDLERIPMISGGSPAARRSFAVHLYRRARHVSI